MDLLSTDADLGVPRHRNVVLFSLSRQLELYGEDRWVYRPIGLLHGSHHLKFGNSSRLLPACYPLSLMAEGVSRLPPVNKEVRLASDKQRILTPNLDALPGSTRAPASPNNAVHPCHPPNVAEAQLRMPETDRSTVLRMNSSEAQQDELNDLRKSHTNIAHRLHRVEEDIRKSRRLLDAERTAIIAHLQFNDLCSIARTISFSRRRASKLLQNTSTELDRRVLNVTRADSVVPFVLRSLGSDCTLLDFQTLAVKFLSDPSTTCRALPSEYHIRFPNLRFCSRMSIVFETYADLCEALELDITTREAGVYREKGNASRQVRAIQVLGSHMQDSSTRSILLGRSVPTLPAEGTLPTLYQNSLVWSEDPGAWESEFVFRQQPVSDFCASNARTADDATRCMANQSVPSTNESFYSIPRLKRARKRSNTPRQFALLWERFENTDNCALTPNAVVGAVYSIFPAVVVRTSILLRSTSNIFKGRGIDVDLTALLTTPRHKK